MQSCYYGIGLLNSFEQKATPIFPAYDGSEYEYKINQPIKSRELREV